MTLQASSSSGESSLASNDDFEDISMTLKEISDSLNQSHHIQRLSNNIQASSIYLKELLCKQECSHQKLQHLQTNLQTNQLQDSLPQFGLASSISDEKESSYSLSSETDVSLSSVLTYSNMSDNGFFHPQRVSSKTTREVVSSNSIQAEHSGYSSEAKETTSLSCDESLNLSTDSKMYISAEPLIVTGHVVTCAVDANKHVTDDADTFYMCFQLMEARIRELEMERDKIALNTILSLRRQIEAMYDGKSMESIPECIAKMARDALLSARVEEIDRFEWSVDERVCGLLKHVQELSSENLTLSVQLRLTRERNEKVMMMARCLEEENDDLNKKLRNLSEANVSLSHQKTFVCEQLSCSSARIENLLSVERYHLSALNDNQHVITQRSRRLNEELSSVIAKNSALKRENEILLITKEADTEILKHYEEKLRVSEGEVACLHLDLQKVEAQRSTVEQKSVGYKQKLKKVCYRLVALQKQNDALRASLAEKDTITNDALLLRLGTSSFENKTSNNVIQKTSLTEKETANSDLLLKFGTSFFGRETTNNDALKTSLSEKEKKTTADNQPTETIIKEQAALSSDTNVESHTSRSDDGSLSKWRFEKPANSLAPYASEGNYDRVKTRIFLNEMSAKLKETAMTLKLTDDERMTSSNV